MATPDSFVSQVATNYSSQWTNSVCVYDGRNSHLFYFSLDTHTKTNELKLPEGDVLLHAGDFSNIGKPGDIERFCEFLRAQPHPQKVPTLRSLSLSVICKLFFFL